MDIIATKQAVAYARKWAVDDDKGPLLLEFVTYRYGGHSYVFLFCSSFRFSFLGFGFCWTFLAFYAVLVPPACHGVFVCNGHHYLLGGLCSALLPVF